MPGTIAAVAQPVQEMLMPTSPASLAASGLAAIAVRNMALVMIVPWNAAIVRKAPILRAVPSSDRLPYVSESDFKIGNTTPPARAVLLGMAGASTRSVA